MLVYNLTTSNEVKIECLLTVLADDLVCLTHPVCNHVYVLERILEGCPKRS